MVPCPKLGEGEKGLVVPEEGGKMLPETGRGEGRDGRDGARTVMRGSVNKVTIIAGRSQTLVTFLLLLLLPVTVRAVSEGVSCKSEVQTYICLPANYSSMDIPFPNRVSE